MGTWMDLTHTLYIVISLIITIIILIVAKKLLVKDVGKQRFLKFFALATFLLHISIMWVEYLNNGSALAADNILFPKYFCNAAMYMMLIVAFWENRSSKLYRIAAILTAYGGFFGATISLLYPEYYFGHSIQEWQVLKSMLSHSTMLVGSIWLIIGGFFKINRSNVLDYTIGLIGFTIIGYTVNFLFAVNDLPDPNAMYLSRPPLADVPLLNAWVIALLMLIVVFGFSWIVERSSVKNSAMDASDYQMEAQIDEHKLNMSSSNNKN